MSQRYFAAITPGLEDVLMDELRTMRVRKLSKIHGGVEFDATGVGFMQVMHSSRYANRVALRLDSFRARDAMELFRKVKRMDWARLLTSDSDVSIDAFSKSSKLRGTGDIAQRVRDGIRASWDKRAGDPPSFKGSETNAQRIIARMEDNYCHLSLDASGELMHRRGWRLKSGSAPLRETLAAALLSLLGWKPGDALYDPMCGSGTFLLEAARFSVHLPPRNWSFPRYAFQRWASFQAERWEEMLTEQSESIEYPQEPLNLYGSDKESKVLSIAQENEKRADVEGLIQWSTLPASEILPPCETGFIIANPPYGERLDRKVEGRKGAERILIERFAKSFSGWTLGVLLPADFSVEFPGLEATSLARFRNGGKPVIFWRLKHA